MNFEALLFEYKSIIESTTYPILYKIQHLCPIHCKQLLH